MFNALENITKNVAVLDMNLLVGFSTIVGVYGKVGIKLIPHGREICTPHYHAEGVRHPIFPMTVVPVCLIHWRASQRM